jgi:hypothetical protein
MTVKCKTFASHQVECDTRASIIKRCEWWLLILFEAELGITGRTHGPCAFIITTFSCSHVNEEVSCMPINICIFLGGCCCRDSTTIWRTMIRIIAAEVLAFGLQLQVTAADDAFASPTEGWGNGLQTYKPPIGPSNLI